MKPIFIALVLITPHFAHSEQTLTNRLTRSGTEIMERVQQAGRSMNAGLLMRPLRLAGENTTTPVLVMEPLQSAAVRDLFPKLTVYRLISSRDIIHQARFCALLVDTNGSPSHLQTDEEVAFFLGGMSDQMRSKEDALRLVRAFADLRSYRIVESPPDFPDVRAPEKQPASADTDYKFVAEERKDT